MSKIEIITKTVYKTTDGKHFENREEAKCHQKFLDFECAYDGGFLEYLYLQDHSTAEARTVFNWIQSEDIKEFLKKFLQDE